MMFEEIRFYLKDGLDWGCTKLCDEEYDFLDDFTGSGSGIGDGEGDVRYRGEGAGFSCGSSSGTGLDCCA